ncbi:MAG TPA: SpoIIE family protein phosphatase [Solirubrobacteraceae bacterium]|nr:SpoIIE family protein phosphatase [Solirubrobacteraceae bacterium]
MAAGKHEAVTGALAERYARAFSSYLADRDERSLGAAYDLGREAVASQLSVLAVAEAHHAALLRAFEDGGEPAEIIQAGAEFLRESLSLFESVHRGYHEVQEVARLEHAHVRQLRALADASVEINSQLTVEEILQHTADTAREVLATARATVTIDEPDPRLRPLTATSPPEDAARIGDPQILLTGLSGRGHALGTLEAIDHAGREFTPRDEAILTQLAQLASVAIANAQLYDREHTIAHTLQRSLRPGALPIVPGVSAAVRFRPAGEGVELGGDFYDLFRARGGGWAAVIGDVQGKGPDAAAVTALARHTLRAAAAYEARPSGVLGLLHRALHEQNGDRFLTVAYAHLRASGGGISLELACGGHPLPLVVHPDGTVQPVGALGTLLGTDIEPQLTDVRVHLDEGDVLVLYTDGVTEVRRRRREVFGQRQLTDLLATCGGLPPDAIADRVEAAVLEASEGQLRDDVAILALGPTPKPDAAHMLPSPTEENDG